VEAHCKVQGHAMVSCAKMAKPIQMPFGKKTQMGSRNHELGGVPIPPWEWALLRGVCTIKSMVEVSGRTMDECMSAKYIDVKLTALAIYRYSVASKSVHFSAWLILRCFLMLEWMYYNC